MEEIKTKEPKWQVQIMKVIPYKGVMVVIRRIRIKKLSIKKYGDYFEYFFYLKGNYYSNFMVFTPEKGKKSLTKEQIQKAGGMIFAAALTTIDTLLNKERVEDKIKREVKKVIEKVGGIKNA